MFINVMGLRLRVLRVAGLVAVTSSSLCQVASAQTSTTYEWTWLGGSSVLSCTSSTNGPVCSQPGVYGAWGVPAAGNVPGSRSGANSWTDSNGNLWLFGGTASGGGELNELWEFSPSTKEWAWMGGNNTVGNCTTLDGLYTYCGWPGVYGTLGTPAVGNIPGGRDSAISWTDHYGNLWLFGGEGFDSNGYWGWLNDLWEFSPSTKEWAWMGGNNSISSHGTYGTLGTPAAGNVPGSRLQATSWTDSKGNLWLFGGFGYDSAGTGGDLNDLWEFDPLTKEWTWIGGRSTSTLSGVYGTLGVPAAGNVPGGRSNAVNWTDSGGNLWLFGGFISNTSNQTWGILNDLWEFNPSTKEWVWMAGSSTSFQPGVYGTLGTPAAGNVPGSRSGAVSWTDTSDNLWLFGGNGDDSTGFNGDLNDLWEFNPSTKEWAWMGGSNSISSDGVYGTLGTPAAGNIPGARQWAVNWTDQNGNLWLFGGEGYDSSGSLGLLNDLWVYQLSASILPKAATPTFSPGAGTYSSGQTVEISDTSPGATIYYSTNGTAPSPVWTVYSAPITVSSPETIETIAMASGYSTSAVATATYTFSAATPTFYPPAGTYNSVQSVAISDASAGTTIYYATDGTAPTTGSTVYSRPITVSSSETIKAIAAGSGYLASDAVSATYILQAATPVLYPPSGTYNAATVTISDATAWTTIYYTTNGTVPTTSSKVYTGPIGVSSTETIEATAVAAGFANSAAGSATYTISSSAPTTDEWNWVGGSSMFWSSADGNCFANHYCGLPGVYGTLGTAAAANLPGGREDGATWTDSSGNLWLFGGYGALTSPNDVEYLNDLWSFNPSSHQWTWVSGSNTGHSTYDGCIVGSTSGRLNNCGQPGVYGTLGVAAVGNVPGGREFASNWLDSNGNLWVFGGCGIDANDNLGSLNDLWEFSPSASLWTWIAGSNSVVPDGDINIGHPGVYGTLGVAASGNAPGSRTSAASWTDRSGSFWLFGGSGYDANGLAGNLNDLWKFNPATQQWAWMGGRNTIQGPTCQYGVNVCAQPGVYGEQGVPAAANIPGGRINASVWSGRDGTIYLFGGYGADSNDSLGDLNDLWAFNPSTNEWTWVSGSNTDGGECTSEFNIKGCTPSGVYGTLGVPGAANIPGGRHSAVSWTDNSGNLWLFGGTATYMADVLDPAEYTSINAQGNFNDLWEFNPSNNEWAWMGGSNGVTGQTVGLYGTSGLPAAGNMPGGRYRGHSWTDSGGDLWLFGGWGVDSTGTWFGYLDDLWKYQPSLATSSAPSISAGGIVPVDSTVGIIQPGEWVSVFGTNLASSTVVWNEDFPTSLGGTSVTIDGKEAYLWYVSLGQINLQVPDDTATGTVPVVVTTGSGSATASVTLARFAPSFLLLDGKHVAGIILRPDGSGSHGSGNYSYDILGPTGTSLGYPTVAAKAGDIVELFGTGFGPTNPTVLPGQAYSGAAATTNTVSLLVNRVSVTPIWAGLSGAGLDQINLTIPAGLGAGDVPLVAMVGGMQTPSYVVISLQ